MVVMNDLTKLLATTGEYLFCDTETDGLHGPVRLVQIFDGTDTFLFDTDEISTDDFEQLKHILVTKSTVWHNAAYDLECLDIKPVPELFEDTLLLSKLVFINFESFSLDSVAAGIGMGHHYAGLDKKAMQKQGFKRGEVITDDQLKYAIADVIVTAEIWKRVCKAKDTLSYKLDKASIIYALTYQKKGIPVHRDRVKQELAVVEEQLALLEPQLPINPSSPKQCKEYLGVDSTDKAALLKLISLGNDKAKLIYDVRRLKKAKVMLESYDYDRVYTRFNVAGARTGRMSTSGEGLYAGVNAQQIPRKYKHLFRNPSDDVVTISCDYSTLELRLAATIYGDDNMRRQLIAGKDLHTELAKSITGKLEVTKEDRTRAKAGNFGFVYGMSAPSFKEYAFTSYGVTFTDEECANIRNTYFKMYPAIARYHKYVWSHYKDDTFFAETALGRKVKPKLGTDAINTPVQGSGAEVTKLAIHYFEKDYGGLKYIVNVVHDSIVIEVPNSEAGEWTNNLVKSMEKAWHEIGKSNLFKFKDIPIKVDAEVVE